MLRRETTVRASHFHDSYLIAFLSTCTFGKEAEEAFPLLFAEPQPESRSLTLPSTRPTYGHPGGDGRGSTTE